MLEKFKKAWSCGQQLSQTRILLKVLTLGCLAVLTLANLARLIRKVTGDKS